LRSVLNPTFSNQFNELNSVKWVIVLSLSTYLISKYPLIKNEKKKKVDSVLLFLSFFTLYNLINSFVTSSLPLISFFKVISYSFVFASILIGVSRINHSNYLRWNLQLFSYVVLISLIFIESPVGYLRNGVGFQGILNHPNLFGVTVSLGLALFLSSIGLKKSNNWLIILSIIVSFVLIYFSQSRTSLGTALVLTFIFSFIYFVRLTKARVILLTSLISTIILLTWTNDSIISEVSDFFKKGQTSQEIFKSRDAQFGSLLNNFESNPLFGTGFATPVLSDKLYIFSFDFIVEPGNIFLAVLSYAGIIGFFLFILYQIVMFLQGKTYLLSSIYLFIAPLLISMGEMVYFSTNNTGIFCYSLISMYICWEEV